MQLMICRIVVINIKFGNPDDKSQTQLHNIAVVSYNYDRQMLNVITPRFITEIDGIPCEWPSYTTDRSTAFFDMPY